MGRRTVRVDNWEAFPVRLLPALAQRYTPFGIADGATQADVFFVRRNTDGHLFAVKQYRRSVHRVGPIGVTGKSGVRVLIDAM